MDKKKFDEGEKRVKKIDDSYKKSSDYLWMLKEGPKLRSKYEA